MNIYKRGIIEDHFEVEQEILQSRQGPCHVKSWSGPTTLSILLAFETEADFCDII